MNAERRNAMALPWVRMDCNWWNHPKFLMLIEDRKYQAVTAYWAAVGWSGGHGQAGFLPYFALSQIHATRKQAGELVEVRLFEVDEGGWQIHDWADYQPSTEENEARSKRARDAAMTRWHGKNPKRNAG
jgi:hypothetical protein